MVVVEIPKFIVYMIASSGMTVLYPVITRIENIKPSSCLAYWQLGGFIIIQDFFKIWIKSWVQDYRHILFLGKIE